MRHLRRGKAIKIDAGKGFRVPYNRCLKVRCLVCQYEGVCEARRPEFAECRERASIEFPLNREEYSAQLSATTIPEAIDREGCYEGVIYTLGRMFRVETAMKERLSAVGVRLSIVRQQNTPHQQGAQRPDHEARRYPIESEARITECRGKCSKELESSIAYDC